MEKEIIETRIISDAIRKAGVPLSPVVKANALVSFRACRRLTS